jgi:hypothetical protein
MQRKSPEYSMEMETMLKSLILIRAKLPNFSGLIGYFAPKYMNQSGISGKVVSEQWGMSISILEFSRFRPNFAVCSGS